MKRPARSPSALLTLQFRNDISEPWMSDWVGTVLSMNLPLYSIYPHSRNAMTSRPIKKTPAIRSADRFPDFPPRDDMQNSLHLDHLDQLAHQATLRRHFGSYATTIVLSEIPVRRSPGQREATHPRLG